MWLEKLFKLKENATDIRTEVLAGTTTFMTMAYIIFVQPAILSQCGMDFNAVMVATCVSSAIGCFLMGLLANYPIALAPAMGHNVYFAFVACPMIAGILGPGSDIAPWRVALGAVLLSGMVFIFFSFFGIRERIIKALPVSIRNAIAVGIGLLITLIGFEWSGLTVPDKSIYLTLGKLNSAPVLLSLFGLVVISSLMARKVRGAILIGMVITAAAGTTCGIIRYSGITSSIPSISPTFMRLSFSGALDMGFLELIFVFFFLDLFDTVGTLIGVSEKAGFMKDNELPRAKQALFADATATVTGAVLGTSTVTSYVESASGVSQGGRTGLANVVTGLLMLLALFFRPLIAMIGTSHMTADGLLLYPVISPVLIIVGCMMMSCVKKIDWDDLTEAIPAFLTIAVMPFCGFSITEGISFGFISYVILKTVSGKMREIPAFLSLFAGLFILRYIFMFAR
ncbi:MAG: NCS2 family permease [Candidatus Omnitrophica bacterium]|nr:NCS2 family permease [Candidatus Omnitrophota bacterium]MDD5487500.1 NCS2 family permease [Candidatus Omnitrophota bacterium]